MSELAPCGGSKCWKTSAGDWIHREISDSCSVYSVTGVHKGLSFEDLTRMMLDMLGEDSTREGLKETPFRVARAWKEYCSGYSKTPADVIKHFEDGAATYDEMVVLKDTPFYSHCEHHLAPFFGTATVAYIPSGRVLGLSKLSRLVDIFARRLQVQERLTSQVADALFGHAILHPTGVGVMIKARHLCMESRGIKQQGHVTVTSALRGAILDKPAARAEFLNLAGNGGK